MLLTTLCAAALLPPPLAPMTETQFSFKEIVGNKTQVTTQQEGFVINPSVTIYATRITLRETPQRRWLIGHGTVLVHYYGRQLKLQHLLYDLKTNTGIGWGVTCMSHGYLLQAEKATFVNHGKLNLHYAKFLVGYDDHAPLSLKMERFLWTFPKSIRLSKSSLSTYSQALIQLPQYDGALPNFQNLPHLEFGLHRYASHALALSLKYPFYLHGMLADIECALQDSGRIEHHISLETQHYNASMDAFYPPQKKRQHRYRFNGHFPFAYGEIFATFDKVSTPAWSRAWLYRHSDGLLTPTEVGYTYRSSDCWLQCKTSMRTNTFQRTTAFRPTFTFEKRMVQPGWVARFETRYDYAHLYKEDRLSKVHRCYAAIHQTFYNQYYRLNHLFEIRPNQKILKIQPELLYNFSFVQLLFGGMVESAKITPDILLDQKDFLASHRNIYLSSDLLLGKHLWNITPCIGRYQNSTYRLLSSSFYGALSKHQECNATLHYATRHRYRFHADYGVTWNRSNGLSIFAEKSGSQNTQFFDTQFPLTCVIPSTSHHGWEWGTQQLYTFPALGSIRLQYTFLSTHSRYKVEWINHVSQHLKCAFTLQKKHLSFTCKFDPTAPLPKKYDARFSS